MFTGIVSELGEVRALEPTAAGVRLDIGCSATLKDLEVGDSVAVNGVCLTVVSTDDTGFGADVVNETLQRTNLGQLAAGSPVDLERPMRADGSLDGHFVQGHVDGVGTVASIDPEGESTRMRVTYPDDLAPYIVDKGSVCLDGVSLTVTDVAAADRAPQWFEVALIPHTLRMTVLGNKAVGDHLNLEVDVIAKYVQRVLEAYR